ncbi:MAG: EthD domain-containing protein [Sphingomonas sp.]
MTHKILLFMKRRPGMSMEAFEDYYERTHAPLALEHGGGMTRYVRRYLTPHPNPDSGESGELPYDVVTELWFEDERIYRAAVRYISTAIMPDAVVEDEARLFDRARIRMATVTERETDLR